MKSYDIPNTFASVMFWIGGVSAMLIGMVVVTQNITEFTPLSLIMCGGEILMFIGGVCLVFMSADLARSVAYD